MIGEKTGSFALRLLYDFVFLLVMILGSPYFLYRIITTSRFRAGLAERFGFVGKRSRQKPCLWVHGVSVGETKAARPFVALLSERRPEMEIVISNTTEGGHDLADRLFPQFNRFYYPLDFSPIVRKMFRRIAPSGIVLMELEIWPNFLLEARRLGVPVFVVNGRLSQGSFEGYRRIRGLLPQFDWVDLYTVQSEQFAARFRELGVPPERILVTGNVKFDEVAIAPRDLPRDPEIVKMLGLRAGENVLIGGSTHDSEEASLYRTAKNLEKKGLGSIRLIVAPRHPDRTELVIADIASCGGKAVRLTEIRSGLASLSPSSVLVVDTIGELEKFYTLADLVFVGGSLIPRGGHNVLEPAAMGKAVVVGPHTFNFLSEVTLLAGGGALIQVPDEAGLLGAMQDLLSSPEKRKAVGAKAIELIRQNQGATLRAVEAIEKRLLPK